MHDRTHGARRRPRSLPIAVVLLAAAGCAGTAPPPAPANPADLLMTGHGRRVEIVGDTLYVLTAERGLCCDATADARRDVAPLPVSLAMPSAVVLGGRIHVLGGMPAGDDEPAVHVYDPTTDTWTSHR